MAIIPHDALELFYQIGFGYNVVSKTNAISSSPVGIQRHCLAFNEYRMMQAPGQQRLRQKCHICGDGAAPILTVVHMCFCKALKSSISLIGSDWSISLVHRLMFFDRVNLESGAFDTQAARRRAFARKSLNQKQFICSATTRNLS
jgi:hypothetical protein